MEQGEKGMVDILELRSKRAARVLRTARRLLMCTVDVLTVRYTYFWEAEIDICSTRNRFP